MRRRQSAVAMTVYTIGHGTMSVEALAAALHSAGVRALVDVRAYPRSRHNPQFNKESLAGSLPELGLAYEWAQALGGRRRPLKDSRNIALRNDAFRAYGDYMRTPEFASALDALLRVARAQATAIMCSETVWWRCHRRLIADALVLLEDAAVVHLMPRDKQVAHRLTDGVRVADGMLAYDVKNEDGRP